MARILIANADPIERLILIGALESAGHEVVEARDGTDAIELAADTDPRALVLDEVMPRSGGAETGRAIRRRGESGIPIILLTSRASAARGRGVRSTDTVLKKPIDPDELVAAIDTVLD
ncbi:MAG: response regulator [Thermoleophilia bacterium]|nr:response regulator [Thermoleophilia bacterium]MDH3725129.1 response regulator [Thermoleophilia bacterium]